MITLRQVKQCYGQRPVLQIEQLELQSGERYALIGPNGSGKSTLLRILAGALLPTQGTVTFSDDILREHSIGYLPQAAYAFDFSVLKNVTMALGKRPDAKQAAQKALDIMGMSALLDAKGSSLSGGEKQRMALARMIALPKALLLLDEPTAAMDIAGNELAEQALLQYCAANNGTLVFSTHSPAQAERLATRVIMLHEGSVLEEGEASLLLRDPKNEHTKRFLQYWRIAPC